MPKSPKYQTGQKVVVYPELRRSGVITAVRCDTIWSLLPVYTVLFTDGGHSMLVYQKEIVSADETPKEPIFLQLFVDKPKPEKLLKSICEYSGGQLADFHPAESLLFEFVANYFKIWLKDHGKVQPLVVNMQQLKSDVTKMVNSLPEDARPHIAVSEACSGYKILNLKSFLGAVLDIGLNDLSHTQSYLFEFSNGAVVFVSAGTHYAYPLLMPGGITPDWSKYKHEYKWLMTHYKDMEAKDALAFIRDGQAPADIGMFTVLTANWICESDRNWLQLMLSLLELGRMKETTCKCYEKGKFPMGGGGWKNANSWGPGTNRNVKGDPDMDGRGTRRWLLGCIVKNTCSLQQSDAYQSWEKLISHYLGNSDSKAGIEVSAGLQQKMGEALNGITNSKND